VGRGRERRQHAGPLSGRKITDYTATQKHVHVYTFPKLVGGGTFFLRPGQSAYVFTGHGKNQPSSQGSWLLFAGRSAPIWNNTGDVAYLRESNGEFIDYLTVGTPKRHPGGHRRARAA
jgi:hypothetical protein